MSRWRTVRQASQKGPQAASYNDAPGSWHGLGEANAWLHSLRREKLSGDRLVADERVAGTRHPTADDHLHRGAPQAQQRVAAVLAAQARHRLLRCGRRRGLDARVQGLDAGVQGLDARVQGLDARVQ
eukprot:241347-Chlamydomonas_euryale.AAC.1